MNHPHKEKTTTMTNTRINWKTAFAALLADPALTGRDRDVIVSMHAHYQRGKSMTSGHKRYFLLIQERTERAAEAMRLRSENGSETEMGTRLFDLGVVMGDGSTWDHGYVESLTLQEIRGGTLTTRQIEILERIEGNWTEDMIRTRIGFAENYNSNKDGVKDDFLRLMKYYKANPPYFNGEVTKWENDPDGFVPSSDTYNKVVSSKYAQKVLEGYTAAPKYTAGALVFANSKLPHNAAMWMLKGALVMNTTGAIISACKNNKLYTLLPIGGTALIQVEERYLKGRK
jgi:hypothetical protein